MAAISWVWIAREKDTENLYNQVLNSEKKISCQMAVILIIGRKA